MKILLIEDDPEIAQSLSLALRANGFIVDIANDGEQGLFLALNNAYNIVILDYNLPGINGQEVLAKIRDKGFDLPVIMLTVRSEISDKVSLLNYGADDYLTKPFALSELIARIKMVIKRSKRAIGNVIDIGQLKLNTKTLNVALNNHDVQLTSKEFSLLQCLMENRGAVVSRQDIIEQVWDDRVDPFSNTIEVHIMRIRKKIRDKDRKIIITCSNRGYKIIDKTNL